MGKGLLQAHLEAFEKIGAGVADERREGYDRQYEYQKARKSIRRRDEFFAGMRAFFNRYLFENWDAFIGFVGQDDDPGG